MYRRVHGVISKVLAGGGPPFPPGPRDETLTAVVATHETPPETHPVNVVVLGTAASRRGGDRRPARAEAGLDRAGVPQPAGGLHLSFQHRLFQESLPGNRPLSSEMMRFSTYLRRFPGLIITYEIAIPLPSDTSRLTSVSLELRPLVVDQMLPRSVCPNSPQAIVPAYFGVQELFPASVKIAYRFPPFSSLSKIRAFSLSLDFLDRPVQQCAACRKFDFDRRPRQKTVLDGREELIQPGLNVTGQRDMSVVRVSRICVHRVIEPFPGPPPAPYHQVPR